MPADFLTTVTKTAGKKQLKFGRHTGSWVQCVLEGKVWQQEHTVAGPSVCIIGRQQKRNVGTQLAPFFKGGLFCLFSPGLQTVTTALAFSPQFKLSRNTLIDMPKECLLSDSESS